MRKIANVSPTLGTALALFVNDIDRGSGLFNTDIGTSPTALLNKHWVYQFEPGLGLVSGHAYFGDWANIGELLGEMK